MKVLVGYSSRHGATRQIAERVAAVLARAGHRVDTRPFERAGSAQEYDGFVLGSAIYRGRWLTGALEYVLVHRGHLSRCPVWLFSSGPLGDLAEDAAADERAEGTWPDELEEIQETIPVRGYRLFGGALDPSTLSLGERALRRLLPSARALLPRGDFRDWTQIEAWADSIARELTALDQPRC